MANLKITQFYEILGGSVAGGDFIPLVDVSDTTMGPSGTNKKIKVSELLSLASATPAGSDGQIQWNNSGAFGASSNLHWDKINNRLSVGMGSSPAARVDILAPGALSSDIGLRVRNSANTANIIEVRGDGLVRLNSMLQIGSYLNPNTTATIFSNENIVTYIGAGLNTQYGLYVGCATTLQNNSSMGIFFNRVSSLSASGNIHYGAVASIDGGNANITGIGFSGSSGTVGTNIGVRASASGGVNNISFFSASGNVVIGSSATIPSTTGNGNIVLRNSTIPSGDVVDAFQLYSADIVAGNAAPHFRTEAGQIIRLYQETTAVGSSTFVAGSGTAVNDTSTFDGFTIAQVVKALRNLGILA